MKRSIAFLLILFSSISFRLYACGPYYPLGDDIRFTLLNSGVFNYSDFVEFNYSSGLFYSVNYGQDVVTVHDSIDGAMRQNIALWRSRCKDKPTEKDVYRAVYRMGADINKPNCPNTFVRYLHEHHDKDALAYLNFAKKCNPYNTVISDPWERQEYVKVPQRQKMIEEAKRMAQSVKDEDIRQRYAFLAIRLAYYNDDSETLQSIFNNFFGKSKTKNIIDYWSLYFNTLTEQDSVRRNFNAAQVFAYAPDKRMAISQRYNKNIPVERTLQLAKNSDEKIAVWMMSGFRKTGKALDVLKELYLLNPSEAGLSFLLLREVNKLEDWIYTPYYTCFNPSLEPWEYEQKAYPVKRIEEDRIYAKKMLQFVQSANLKKVENPVLWKFVRAYLYYMTENYTSSLNEITSLQKQIVSNLKLRRQLDVLKAICLTAGQTNKPMILNEIKSTLVKEFSAGNYKLIFAVARELEFKGNTTDAAALLSKFKLRAANYDDETYWRNGIYWKTRTNNYTLFVDYYDDYFFYLDAQYTPDQLKKLITDVESSNNKEQFNIWKYDVLRKDLSRLYDLLGTKLMRKNELNNALSSFVKVADTLWTSTYYPYHAYLDANPFSANMFSGHHRTDGDTIQYTKVGIARTLIDYLGKAENVNEKRRDYYYFLVANCYLNMTQYGNSWMMKRYYWTVNFHDSEFEDNDDYYNCTLAKKYYLKAKEVSRNDRFAALCLRMAGRCENHRIFHQKNGDESNPLSVGNTYYNDLKKQYPTYSTDLISNCESFNRYFKYAK